MSDNKRHSELLIKLSQGVISEKEKWELERASLDDAFLADAIEGYYNSQATHELSRISIRSVRYTTKETVQISLIKKWIAVAASLLVLFSVSFWAFNQSGENSSNLLSESHESKQKINRAQSTISAANLPDKEKALSLAENDKYEAVTENEITEKSLPSKVDKEEKMTPGVKKKWKKEAKKEDSMLNSENMDSIVGASTQMSESKSTNVDAKGKAEPCFENAPAFQKVKQPNVAVVKSLENIEFVPFKLVSGTVRDLSGTPIANVALTSEEGVGPVFTDKNGLFEMELAKEDITIIATADGFVSKTIRAGSDLNINLNKARRVFYDPPKMLAELMSLAELNQHYKNELGNYFKGRNILQCNNSFKSWKKIKMTISITKDNMVEGVQFLNEIEEPCQISIENIIQQASYKNIFNGSQNITFNFELSAL